MIINEEERKGLSFNDWIDVLLTIEDDAIIGNPLLDLDGPERFWMQFLIEWRKVTVPDKLKVAKGIGNWVDPKVIIVTDQIQTTTRLASGQGEYGHKYWNIPKYRRLRPFMENKTNLRFFYNLIHGYSPEIFYITSFKKSWLGSAPDSYKLFRTEMFEMEGEIICLGHDVYEKMEYWKNRKLLDWPTFVGTWHGHDWQRYYERFRNLISH